jgi:hypothetical protein
MVQGKGIGRGRKRSRQRSQSRGIRLGSEFMKEGMLNGSDEEYLNWKARSLGIAGLNSYGRRYIHYT